MSAETDRAEIVAVLDRYAEALDRRRWELLRDVFADDVRIDFGEWTATSRDQAVAAFRSYLDACGPSQHLLGNYHVHVDGDAVEALGQQRQATAFKLGIGGGDEAAELRQRRKGNRYIHCGRVLSQTARNANGRVGAW